MRRKEFTFGEISYVSVSSSNTRNKKPDKCLFSTELAKELEQYFESKPAMPHIRSFSSMHKDSGSKMLKPDLKRAEIEYTTDEGIINFHSLRHTFATMAALSGVTPQELQKMMRHSDINLTMKYYVHIVYLIKQKP